MIWRFGKKLLVLLAGLLGVLLAACWALGLYVSIGVDERNPPPGRLVDIGHTRLHIACSGAGSPTVILETGSNAWSSSWSVVQQELAGDTRVCSYDRGGLGWSEAGAKPRNYATQLAELEALLAASGEGPPYLMVGWSYGGPLAWLYTARNPERVQGIVMVDSGTYRYQHWIEENYPQLYSMSQLGPKIMEAIHALGLGAAVLTLAGSTDGTNPFFASMRTSDVGFLLRSFPGILEEGSNMAASMQDMFGEVPGIGAIPLVVIESGNVMQVPGMPGLGEELKAQFHQDQLHLLGLSTRAEYVVAGNSGHNIPDEAPGVIVAAVRRVLAEVGH